MVINKEASKIYIFFILQVTFLSLNLVGTVFNEIDFLETVSFASIISSHVNYR